MHAKKLVKWGVALTSALVLGGVVTPTSVSLLSAPVVYAQEVLYYKVHHITWDLDNTNTTVLEETLPIYPGETKTVSSHAKKIDGWHYDASGDFSKPLTYSDVLSGKQNSIPVVYSRPAGYKIVEKPAETPTEKPVETPTEQPITYRIHYFLNDVAENGGTPSYTDIAPYKEGVIAKGETIVEVAPHIDGYAVAGNNTISVTYDHVAGDNVWHDEDWYPAVGFLYDKVDTPAEKPVETPAEQPAETPIEQPTEQPAETPAEQPVEQPVETPVEQPAETLAEKPIEQPAEQVVDTPTDKPVEQLTDASSLTDQAAGKDQPVATTDKKKVDTSTPSTSPVASQDTAKPTAKSLPKTGDSGSILLGLGGFLSGLSGLGLAARSRKKD